MRRGGSRVWVRARARIQARAWVRARVQARARAKAGYVVRPEVMGDFI